MDRRGIEDDGHIGIPHLQCGGFHAEPVAADGPQAGGGEVRATAALCVSGVEQHSGHVGHVRLVVAARHQIVEPCLRLGGDGQYCVVR